MTAQQAGGREGRMTGLRRGLSAFRHRNYRLFFTGQAISLVGTWMQQVAQAWLVLTLTHDPLWLGVVVAAQFLPILIFGLFAGVLADTLPKRQTLIATQVAKMGLSTILAVLAATGNANIPILVLLALIIGAVGVAAAFAIDAASFLAVIIGLLAMHESELNSPTLKERPTSLGGVMDQLREGLHYVRVTPLALIAVLVVGLVSTVGMNFSVIMPPYAQDVLNSDAAGYGFLMAASGVGSLIGALWLAFGGAPRVRRIAYGAIVLGVGEIALGLSQVFPVSLLLMVAVGFGGITMAATSNTTLQLAVPDGLRGRVMSVYTTIFAGSTPIGGPLMGGIASLVGVAASLAIGGVVAAGVGVGALVWIRRRGLDLRPVAASPASGAERGGAVERPNMGPAIPDAARPH